MRRSIRMTGRVLSSRILAGDDITNTVRLSTRVEPEPKWPWILLIVVSSIVAIGAIGVGGSYLFHRPSVKEETRCFNNKRVPNSWSITNSIPVPIRLVVQDTIRT